MAQQTPVPARRPSVLWALIGLDGRVSREVFWLGNLLCAFLGTALLRPYLDETGMLHFNMGMIAPLVFVALAWTELALVVKRLHDRGLTGWLAGMVFVPILGVLPFFIVGLLPGQRGPNLYGPDTNTRGLV